MHDFLWEHATFDPAKFKPFSRSLQNLAWLISLAISLNALSLIKIRPLGVARPISEACTSGTFLVNFFFFVT